MEGIIGRDLLLLHSTCRFDSTPASSSMMFFEDDDDGFSTGYLQDALFQFRPPSSKRRITPQKSSGETVSSFCQGITVHNPEEENGDGKKKKKKIRRKVVYPFAVVKPGEFQGVLTLNEINRRILMPPTRPLRHPVGDFACRPTVSPQGPGLSGKAVIAFTRIRTPGRGTITIIRTKD